MALAETLTNWVETQAQGGVELDPDGGIQLFVADEMAVDIGPADKPGTFAMSAAVGVLPEKDRVAVLQELLIANLEGMGTGGASLSIDRSRDEIVLCRVYHTDDLTPDVFDEEFSAFVNALRFWRDRHKAGKLGTAPTDVDMEDLESLSPLNAKGLVRV